jgi:hypothetical protein
MHAWQKKCWSSFVLLELHLKWFKQLVFFLSSSDLKRVGEGQGLPVVKAAQSMNVNRDECHFGTECFQNVTKMKSRTVLHLLHLGYNVLFSDVDVYWFQVCLNPKRFKSEARLHQQIYVPKIMDWKANSLLNIWETKLITVKNSDPYVKHFNSKF